MDYKKEMIALLEEVSNNGMNGAIPALISEALNEANLIDNDTNGMLECTAYHCKMLANNNFNNFLNDKKYPQMKGKKYICEVYGNKKYICELYGKKSKEQICTCMGKPVYGWGMRFYKDKDCTVIASIDPYHYIRKDKVMLMGGVYVLVHVVK